MISKLITPSISCERVSTMYTDTRSQCGIKAQMYIKCGMDAQKHNEPEHMLIIIYKPFIVTRRIVQHKMTLKLEVFMPLSPFLPCFRIRDSMCSLQQCHHYILQKFFRDEIRGGLFHHYTRHTAPWLLPLPILAVY